LIDGRQADEHALEKIFEQDDQGFYMGDYILEETGRTESEDSRPKDAIAVVCEPRRDYLTDWDVRRYHLKEIRFDKVYHR
jgi:hypothetical protein